MIDNWYSYHITNDKEKMVVKIDANPLVSKHTNENAILNVAAYCRVSTNLDDQKNSYKAQVTYYTNTISKNPKWRLVGIYADEGISGTQVKHRNDFKRMIGDCRRGKIDLILTKSVARFARNTVDTLNYVRELKTRGIAVYFEEQDIDTLKINTEMVIGLNGVIAQAESENISANISWGVRKRMRDGSYQFRYLLGYKKDENGKPCIVAEEARIVRYIYQLYLDGKSLDQIKTILENEKYVTSTNKTEWSKNYIKSILENERYCGDMLLQKTFVENCITKKVKKNNGELPKYLVINNHPAIIDKETFKLVQLEIARRSGTRKTSTNTITQQGKYSGKYSLSDVLICGECGSPYRRKIWIRKNGNKVVWRCLSRIEHGTTYCKHSLSVEENLLKETIRKGLNKAIHNKEEINSLIEANLNYITTGNSNSLNAYSIEQKLKELKQEMDMVVERMTKTEGDKKRFSDIIKHINDQIVILRKQLEIEKSKITYKENIDIEIKKIKEILTSTETEFHECDDITIHRLIENIRVMEDNTAIITLKGGYQIEESIIQSQI